jgi:WD40 repeat protein
VEAVAVSKDGQWIAAAVDHDVKVFAYVSGEPQFVHTAHGKTVRAVALSPNNEFVASAGDDRRVKIFHILSQRQALSLYGFRDKVESLAYSPDGSILAAGGGAQDSQIILFDTTTGVEVKALAGHESAVKGVCFSPDGNLIASSSEDRRMTVWDWKKNRSVKVYQAHDRIVEAVAWSPNGEFIATASEDKTLKLWDVRGFKDNAIIKLSRHTAQIRGVTFTPDSRFLISVSRDGQIIIWEVPSGRIVEEFLGHGGKGLNDVCVTSDGKAFLTAGSDGLVKVWPNQ